MTMETKQLHNLSKIYREKIAEGKQLDELDSMGSKLAVGAVTGIAAGGAALVNQAKKAGKNLRNKMQQRTQLKTEEKMAKKDYDGDGKVESSKDEYFGSKDKAIKKAMGKKVKNESYSDWRQDLKEIPDYDQIPLNDKKRNEKISEKNVKNTVKINPTMEEGYGGKKKKKHDCASKVKHEQFGIGDCISEAHDLDENGSVAHYDVEFEEYIVKNVPVEELEILEGHMHEHVIRAEVEEGLLDMAKKAVNKKLATAGRNFKGGSVSQTGNYAEKALKSEGYQRNPEADPRSARQKRMDDPERGINSPAFRAFMAAQQGGSKKKVAAKKKTGK